MKSLLAAEILKLRTIRAPWLLFIAAQLIVVAGVSGLMFSGTASHLATTELPAVRHAGLVALLSLILGIMAVAGEYQHRTITDTYLASPRRGRVILAKLSVYTATGFIFGIASAATALVATAIWLAARGSSLDLASGELWRTLIGAVVWNVTFAAIGVGLGALIRNFAGAIAAALAWAALVEGIVGQFLGRFSAWLPVASGSTLVGIRTGNQALPQWAAGLILVGYAVLFGLLAVQLSVRRDVT
ncbi:MAG TPA: ABC transporter permease [Thermomicrobiaceae bacterium]|nr:ABC transporter permease [Thermomicrobiaceae bacterium]